MKRTLKYPANGGALTATSFFLIKENSRMREEKVRIYRRNVFLEARNLTLPGFRTKYLLWRCIRRFQLRENFLQL